LLVAALAVSLLCGGGCATRHDERPNIVLVVLDTVRRDVAEPDLSGVVEAMPAIGALGREATVFVNAWATSPWTLPSHASILTGLLSSGHGCTGRAPMLASEHRTVAEYLVEQGYEAAAFFSNPWLTDGMSGMMRGFESEYVESRGDDRIHSLRGSQGGRASNANIEAWLDRRSDDRPFLLFVNYLEAHLPYDPDTRIREARLPDIPAADRITTTWAYEFNAGLHPFNDVDWTRVRRLYEGDASTSDALLGDLISMLKARGLYENAVIIVTSDHGENVGDHGLMDHQFGVFETLLAVPLVVRAPGRLESGVRDDPVMLIDIFPSILETAGVDGGPDLPRARSLLGPPADEKRPVIAEYAGGNAALIDRLTMLNPDLDASSFRIAYATVRMGDLRLTVGSDGSNALESFAADGAGDIDLEREGRAVALAMKEHLPALGAPVGEIEIDESMREELRSLGYLP
jgi:arylsulfatase A-like enzyme